MPADSLLPTAVRGLIRVSRLIESATGDLSVADWRVLSIIERGEGSPSRVADRLLLSRPTISATLDSLAKRGLIERTTLPDDARAVSISLSADGVELLGRAEVRMSRQLELLCDRTADASRVVAALALLDDAIEAAVTERIERSGSTPRPA